MLGVRAETWLVHMVLLKWAVLSCCDIRPFVICEMKRDRVGREYTKNNNEAC
jgi:hypothetical protein